MSIRIYNYLYRLSIKLKRSSIGMRIYEVLDCLRIRGGVNRFIHWRYRKNRLSQEELMKNRAFFDGKNDEINEVVNLLHDNLSKNVLRSMIRYRCTGNYKDLPQNSFSTQYFINDFFEYHSGEVFVDGGAYDGDTVIRFKRIMAKKRIKNYKIIAFEPDEENFELLKNTHKDIVCKKFGLWDSEETLMFDSEGTLSSRINENETAENSTKIRVTKLDNCDECKSASFIKMDIEGAEYNALMGAKSIIKRNQPTLDICIYHSNEDMLRIVKLVHELNPNYKLYVRQHTNALCETVLYAQV